MVFVADPMYILGIETSCDETAAAVVQNGTDILSSMVSSQVEVHHRYGGVVPELASRKHIEAIVPGRYRSDQRFRVRSSQIDAIAATRGPGSGRGVAGGVFVCQSLRLYP